MAQGAVLGLVLVLAWGGRTGGLPQDGAGLQRCLPVNGTAFPAVVVDYSYRAEITSLLRSHPKYPAIRFSLEERSNIRRRLLKVSTKSVLLSFLFDYKLDTVFMFDHHSSKCLSHPMGFYNFQDLEQYHEFAEDILTVFHFVWKTFFAYYPENKSPFVPLQDDFHRGLAVRRFNSCLEIKHNGMVIETQSSWGHDLFKTSKGKQKLALAPVSFWIKVHKSSNQSIDSLDQMYSLDKMYVSFYEFLPKEFDDSDIALDPERNCKGDPKIGIPALPSSFSYQVFTTNLEDHLILEDYRVSYSAIYQLHKTEFFDGSTTPTVGFENVHTYDYNSKIIYINYGGECTSIPLKARYVEGLPGNAVLENANLPTGAEQFYLDANETRYNGMVELQGRNATVYSRSGAMEGDDWYIVSYFDSKLHEYNGQSYNVPLRIVSFSKENHRIERKQFDIFNFHPEAGTGAEATFDLTSCTTSLKSETFVIEFENHCIKVVDNALIAGFRTWVMAFVKMSALRVGDIRIETEPETFHRRFKLYVTLADEVIRSKDMPKVFLRGQDLTMTHAVLHQHKLVVPCPLPKCECNFTGWWRQDKPPDYTERNTVHYVAKEATAGVIFWLSVSLVFEALFGIALIILYCLGKTTLVDPGIEMKPIHPKDDSGENRSEYNLHEHAL